MLDFGALPPEINSAKMYSGAGSGPLMAAASAWDSIAAQLDSYAAGYSSALSELQGLWSGGASFTMAAAIAPYVAWATATATQAEQTAGQARAAAAAFEAAFAATVPPAVVAANRIQLAVLVATNFFGQNTPAIAATEAEYAEMWAQDAGAMYGYAASSSVAAGLSPFGEPPQATSPAGQSTQAAAVAQAAGTPAGQTQVTLAELMSVLPQQLQALATGASTNATAAPSAESLWTQTLTAFNYFDTFVVNPAQPFWSTAYSVFSAGRFGAGSQLLQFQLAKAAAKAAAAEAVNPGGVRGPVLASVGEAAPVGKLSVPQSWVTANAVAEPIGGHMPLPDTGLRPAPAAADAHNAPNVLGGLPKGDSETTGSFVLRSGRRRFQMPRPPYGG